MVSYQWTQQAAFQWTRIDMLLALLEETVRVLEQLHQAITPGSNPTPQEKEIEGLWLRGRLLVGALLSGVYPQVSEPGRLCWQLYEFVLHVLEHKGVETLPDAVQVLRTLLEAFQTVRAKAVSLERSGVIPGLDHIGLGAETLA